MGGRRFQCAVQGLGQEEGRLQVQVDHLVPAALGEFVEVCAPGGPGVVEQDVELIFLGQIGGGQRLDAIQGRHILRQGDALGSQLFRRLQAGRSLARRDVDLGRPGFEVSLGDHFADAARAAGDQSHLAVQ